MRYIDFDGVILDTEDILFYEWRQNSDRHQLPESAKIKYIQEYDWEYVLKNSSVINASISILKKMRIEDTAILTLVHSLDNDGYQKIKFLRKCGVRQNIILVPYKVRKVDVVDARGNILIDDSLKNLTEWIEMGGYPMFFDKKRNNVDSWGEYNYKGYQRVLKINEKKL